MGWLVALNNLLTGTRFSRILLACPPHLMVLEYKGRMQIEPDPEAFQEVSWLQSTGGISSLPRSLMRGCRFQRDSRKRLSWQTVFAVRL